MKKSLALIMCLVLLAFTAAPAGAQTRYRQRRAQVTQQSRSSYYGYDNRSVWDKHRDKITTGAGALGGALLGGLVGGKKGAIIGALAGGGGAALYTYKIRNNNRRF
jgi:outer membrane lipoprotein SlyB